MNSTEVACGLRASALKSPPHLQAILGLANLQTTIALQVNNYWFGGQTTSDPRANDYYCRFDPLPFRTYSLVALLVHSIAI